MRDFMLFDSALVEAAENGVTDPDQIAKIFVDAGHIVPYLGGWRDIDIEWVPVGTKFKINEYAGYETIEYRDKINWAIA